jgi:tetratricopeptide (TPR) repeat protein
MNSNPSSRRDTTGKSTLIWVAAAAFILGFFSGVILTITKWKSDEIPGKHEAHSNMSQPEIHPDTISALEATAREHSNDPMAWIQLGNAAFDAGLHEKAIMAYEKALSLDSRNANVWTDLGTMYRKAEQLDKAIESFDRAAAIDPEHEPSRFNKGLVLMHDKNDREGAIRAWEELLEINPTAMAPGGRSVDELLRHLKNASQ